MTDPQSPAPVPRSDTASCASDDAYHACNRASCASDDADHACTRASTFRCIICLDDYTDVSRARALRCAHALCTDCLAEAWRREIETASEPFPRCPMPGCAAYASEVAVAGLVGPGVVRRMRQLRSRKPARAADGRRMFCIAEGCLEQLPPPPPPPPLPAIGEGNGGREEEESFVSTCPECEQGVCTRCGCADHSGSQCVKPLTCRRQRHLYHSYAVGRVAECPRCGVHIEKNGGCSEVICGNCRNKFVFRPFRSAEEVEQSSARGEPVAEETSAAARQENGNPVRRAFLQWCLLVLCCLPCLAFGFFVSSDTVEALLKGKLRSDDFLFSTPILLLGLGLFTHGTAAFMYSCVLAISQIGQPGILPFFAATLHAYVGAGVSFLVHSRFVSTCGAWVIYFLPLYLCCALHLLSAVAHPLLIGWRAFRNCFNRRAARNEPIANAARVAVARRQSFVPGLFGWWHISLLLSTGGFAFSSYCVNQLVDVWLKGKFRLHEAFFFSMHYFLLASVGSTLFFVGVVMVLRSCTFAMSQIGQPGRLPFVSAILRAFVGTGLSYSVYSRPISPADGFMNHLLLYLCCLLLLLSTVAHILVVGWRALRSCFKLNIANEDGGENDPMASAE